MDDPGLDAGAAVPDGLRGAERVPLCAGRHQQAQRGAPGGTADS